MKSTKAHQRQQRENNRETEGEEEQEVTHNNLKNKLI